jgi:hypothetical protein
MKRRKPSMIVNGISSSSGRKVAKQLDRTGETGAWLSCVLNRFDGTEVSREEFFDNLSI